MALPVPDSMRWGTRLHTLVLVEEERLIATQTVGGVPLTGCTALNTATTHLTRGVAPMVKRKTDRKIIIINTSLTRQVD